MIKAEFGIACILTRLTKWNWQPIATPLDVLASRGVDVWVTGHPEGLGKIPTAVAIYSKSARQEYNDTGIDLRDYLYFRVLKNLHGINTQIIFVDHEAREMKGLIHRMHDYPMFSPAGAKKGTYPRQEGELVYYPTNSLTFLDKLSDEEALMLTKLTRRRGEWRPQTDIFEETAC